MRSVVFRARAMARAVIAPLFAALAEQMRPALFEVLWMPAGLPDHDLSADDPGAAIRAFNSLYLLGSHSMHLRCPQPTAEASPRLGVISRVDLRQPSAPPPKSGSYTLGRHRRLRLARHTSSFPWAYL